jgi:predicted aminopeptidase
MNRAPLTSATLQSLSLLVLSFFSSGCFTVNYLTQAAVGQAGLLLRSRPLSAVLVDENIHANIRRQLSFVPEVRAFGESHGLWPTDNYQEFTDLHRSAAVFLVQACAPLAFEPKRWTFPVAGTVPYLGFFNADEARAYAQSVERQEHLDVDVRGASAYSTLGWFKDPILSTMLSEEPESLGLLANTILHESVHATVYVPGQSSFNESLASFVADALTPQWLTARFGPKSRELSRYQEAMASHEKRTLEFHNIYERLDALYGSSLTDEEKRSRKQSILSELKVTLKSRRDINNATLFGYRTYDTDKQGFERALQRVNGDWTQLFHALRELPASRFKEPNTTDFANVLASI